MKKNYSIFTSVILFKRFFLKKGIFSEFISLSTLQALNLITPLLLVPFLVKTYGVEKYGWIVICQSFTNYLTIFTDYGFNLTAVREVSASMGNKKLISSVYTSVTIVKAIFFVTAVLLLFSVKLTFPQFGMAINFFILSCFGISFQILFPMWLFQGLNKINIGTAILLGGKILHVILVLFILSKTSSIDNFFYLQGISYLFALLVGTIVINRLYIIKFTKYNKTEILQHVRRGWHIYISNIAVNIYTGSSTLILGAFHGPRASAIFGIADQIQTLLRQPIAIITRIIYPKVCSLAVNDKNKIRRFMQQSIYPLLAVYVVVCFIIFIYATEISYFFSKESFKQVALLIRVLFLIPIIVLIFNTSPYLILLANRLDKINSRISIIGAVIGLVSNLILAYYFSSIGSAISVLITELFVGITLFIIVRIKFPSNSLL